jgi:archaellin
MGKSIETAINKQLPGFRISLGESELELDSETHTPHVRVLNLVLADADGVVIASAPKAGVALNTTALLSGAVSISSLDLIGPRVNIRRNLDGTMQLGIANDVLANAQEIVIEPDQVDGQQDAPETVTLPQTNLVSGARILELLDSGGATGTLANLEEVRLSRGVVKLYDEANDATWEAPRADLAFRRTASGFVIAAKADVASGGEPWKLEASVTYRKEQKNFIANVAVDNLVPANVADEIYALSQFARLNTPMSGNFEINADENGGLTNLEGQVFAAAGQVNLPEYLANPIIIDEGTLRIRQAGAGKPFEILESSVLMGGSRADLKGTISPQKAEDGRVVAYGIELSAANVSVDAQGTVKDPVFIDRVSYKGSFGLEEQRVDIDDLVIMAGAAGVRLRGVITGGEQSAGIQAAGRLRDVNAGLLKKIWPPILAPKTRGWINENVVSGIIDDGVFEVKLKPDELATAQRNKVLPPDAVSLSFSMNKVSTRYFKALPILQNASGKAALKQGKFGLTIDNGFVDLPSGAKLSLAEGRFEATDLLSGAVPGEFQFDIQGGVSQLLEFASLPDLNIVKDDLSKLPKIEGQARAIVGLKLPLIKNVPREKVVITQQVSLTEAAVKNILPGIDLTDGKFEIDLSKDTLQVSGPAKLNGVAATVNWRKSRSGGEAEVAVETTLTEKMRDRLGMKLGAYMSGDVPVKLAIEQASKEVRRIAVEADLSDVDMRVAAAGWTRGATKNTSATFTFIDSKDAGRTIEDLKIDGKGLRVRGTIKLTSSNALRVIDFDEVRLSEDDVFAIRMEPSQGATKLTISGNTFDARPYIKNLISPAKISGGSEGPKGGDFIVTAKFKSVTAHRGESVRNVSGTFVSTSGKITQAELTGTFDSGFPLNIFLEPVAGGRSLRIASTDGGSALRAANFYSKVAGGELSFEAVMTNLPGSPIRNGELVLRKFSVRNEAALAELDSRGRAKKSGPRVDGIAFKRLRMPFKTDAKFVRLCGIELKGNDMGGVAKGIIRKSDGAMDITGTMVPLQGINGVLDDIPLLGTIITGGKGEGLFAVTFAMGGTISKPKTQVNPLSAFLPGVFRKVLEFQGSCG